MRFALNGAVDRVMPLLVLPYAIWTIYVHLITATHSSFNTLLRWLPVAALIAAAATAAWCRLPVSAKRSDPVASGEKVVSGPVAALVARRIGSRSTPFAVLALGIVWVGLLSVGMPYPVFWWMALLATGGAWTWNLRGESHRISDDDAEKHAAWTVLLVAAAAVFVTLVASRPDNHVRD